MTSTVTIAAHCADNKEVRVQVYDSGDQTILEQFIMQNGEQMQVLIYDNRAIACAEMLKEELVQKEA